MPYDLAMGRPPSSAAERAILTAALERLGELGYARMTIEGVAAAAGVAKTTIYRRYADKAELVAAAVAMVREVETAPDTGDARRDFVDLVRRFQALMEGPGRTMLATLLAEEHHAPELLARFRELLIGPSRDRGRVVVERAKRRGAIRADVDAEAVMDMLAGSYFTRRLAGVPVTEDTPEQLVDELWRGIAASPPARASSRPRSRATPRR